MAAIATADSALPPGEYHYRGFEKRADRESERLPEPVT
jgi:hypothetical protein